jgi:hypothetical protein
LVWSNCLLSPIFRQIITKTLDDYRAKGGALRTSFFMRILVAVLVVAGLAYLRIDKAYDIVCTAYYLRLAKSYIGIL